MVTTRNIGGIVLLSGMFFCMVRCTHKKEFTFSHLRDFQVDLPQTSSITHKAFDELGDETVLIYFDRTGHLVHLKSPFSEAVDSVIDLNRYGRNTYGCWNVPPGNILLDGFAIIDSSSNLLVREYQNNALFEVRRDTVIKYDLDLGSKNILTLFSSIASEGENTVVCVYGGMDSAGFFGATAALVANLPRPGQEVSFLNPYPKGSKPGNPHALLPSVVLAGNKVVSSVGYHDSLLVTDLETNTSYSVAAAASGPVEVIAFSPGASDNSMSRFWQDHRAYARIVYDPYNKLYYRVVLDRGDSLFRNTQEAIFKKPWTLLVLDEGFNKVGEMKFTGRDYGYHEIYPTKEGLVLGKNFITDYAFNFDRLAFGLFRVEFD